MNRILKISGIVVLFIAGLLVVGVAVFNLYFVVLNIQAKKQLNETYEIKKEGIVFRDLNKNGRLDVYEDGRESVENRIEDLLSQMTIDEKVGLMWHPPIGVGKKGEVLNKPVPAVLNMASSLNMIVNKKINHFNLFRIPNAKELAEWNNRIQKIAEQTRLGIPVSLSTDPRHGITNFIGADLLGGQWSKWPEPIGLAATGDSLLVAEFGRIASREYRAVGIRTALHPMADLATEPRWARINGTFGEDAELAKKITTAYVFGFQGEELGEESVACMTKHWPGGGPQEDGEDAHFRYGAGQVYPGNNFKYHVLPFDGAFEAGTAMIMPYYGVPKGQTSEDVGMSFNKEIITKKLREGKGYDGVVCTDWGIIEGFKILGKEIVEAKNWGVENLSVKERIKKVIDAGVDQFGGNMNTNELLELIEENELTEDRIDISVRRLLKVKFQLGLFDNPYVDSQKAVDVVTDKNSIEKGKIAQRKSIVLLKNTMNADSSFILPLRRDIKLYTENIKHEIVAKYAIIADSPDEADYAVLRLQTPWEPRSGDMIESFFHQGYLDFREEELNRILSIASEKPTIICMYLDRPAVIPELVENSVGVLGEFGAEDDAVLDIIFGIFNPTARLPFEMPSSMKEVENQKEDLPYDSDNPLFKFGFGLTYK